MEWVFVQGGKAGVRRAAAVRCQGRKKAESVTASEALSKAVAGAALAAVFAAGMPAPQAEAGALVPCKESKAFKKREKNEIKAFQKRLKLVSVVMAEDLKRRRESCFGSSSPISRVIVVLSVVVL